MPTSKCGHRKGEFDLKLTKYEDCTGPKRKTCVGSTVKIHNDVTLALDFTIKENMKAVKGKIIGWMNKNNPLLRVSIRDLCEHIFFRALLANILNNSDQCAFNKGRYQFTVDIQKVSRSFYGSKYMYGNWTFQWIFYSDVCNLHCGLLNLSMTPTKTRVHD
ncbi:hypothetical protein SFRURICE_017417 [Spodoptera frugiperda]|nr:hypothetical protein SFRURICE_017417 [Spodoptera frugiperda]